MSLKDELGLRKEIRTTEHEALLSIYHTASMMRNRITAFLSEFGLTDVQFNLMLLIEHQSGPEGGLTQVELSRMMLVNRANITSLVDRMEKADLVKRTSDSSDRRTNIVKLTANGKKLLVRADIKYKNEISNAVAPLKSSQLKQLIKMLEDIRKKISEKN